MRRPAGLIAVALAATLWSVALVAAPSASVPPVAAATYAAGSLVCHQRAERSFYRGGAQYPVCARCLGLYLGGAVGAFAWIAVAGLGRTSRSRLPLTTRGIRRALAIVATPTLATVIAGWAGWDAPSMVRAALAVPLGAVITAIVAAVAAGDMT